MWLTLPFGLRSETAFSGFSEAIEINIENPASSFHFRNNVCFSSSKDKFKIKKDPGREDIYKGFKHDNS